MDLRVRERFKGLTCPRCEKVDHAQALERGIPEDVSTEEDTRILGRRDFLMSWDNIYVVSKRAMSAFDSCLGSELRYMPIPDTESFVVTAKHVIRPDATAGFFDCSDPCDLCHRYRLASFSSSGPCLPKGTQFAAFQLELLRGEDPFWLVCEAVAEDLKKQKLKGLSLVPYPVSQSEISCT
jgi:hypothetical protein